MSDIIESLRASAVDLLHLPGRRLVAIGSAMLAAVVGLTLVTHLDPAVFGASAQTICAALFAFSLTALVLGGFQTYEESHKRTFDFAPFGHECWAHVTTQRDGRVTTQIVCDLHAFNLSDEARWLTGIRLVWPWTHARVLHHTIMVRHQTREYYGEYEVPARGRTEASGHLIIDADLYDSIAKRGIIIRIADQNKHWHTIRFPHPHLHPRTVVPPATSLGAGGVDGVSVEPSA